LIRRGNVSKLYIKSVNGKLENAVVMLNNQPLDRLKKLELKMDDQGNTVAVVEFVPKAVEVKSSAKVQEKEKKSSSKK
jgi:hypothetical protein